MKSLIMEIQLRLVPVQRKLASIQAFGGTPVMMEKRQSKVDIRRWMWKVLTEAAKHHNLKIRKPIIYFSYQTLHKFLKEIFTIKEIIYYEYYQNHALPPILFFISMHW